MKLFAILLGVFFSIGLLRAECVHEALLSGAELLKQSNPLHMVEIDGRFFPASTLILQPNKKYRVQWNAPVLHSRADIEYYTVERLSEYLLQMRPRIEQAGYRLEVIGKSVEGQQLYAVYPQQFEQKKTILMTGRQHGDESTANWIIEGFLNEFYSPSGDAFRDNFQLVLYPMVNPDGAVARTRYNVNGYDLNRVWSTLGSEEKDEVKIIHNHYRTLKVPVNQVTIALDMHGSIWGMSEPDFIYHVDRSFAGQAFYDHQLSFINKLAEFDPWNGNSNISNGDPKMMRIILVKQGVNALTHETPRDIPLSSGRTIDTLREQGLALFESISEIYGKLNLGSLI